jgi:hypothetical protein
MSKKLAQEFYKQERRKIKTFLHVTKKNVYNFIFAVRTEVPHAENLIV